MIFSHATKIFRRQSRTDKEESIPKLLSITLFYPGILGYFIVEIFRNLLGESFYDPLIEEFDTDRILFLSKLTLIISILIFYSCDFLNSSLTKKEDFNEWGFVCDLFTMISLTIGFKAVIAYHRDDAGWKYLAAHNFALAMFMAVYILAYAFSKKRKKDPIYKVFLAWEMILGATFLGIGILLLCIKPTNTKAWFVISVVFTLVSAFIYISALRYKYVAKEVKVQPA